VRYAKVYRVKYEDELNAEQLEVVMAGDGPLLVIAGAGSGKTRALTYRVSHVEAARQSARYSGDAILPSTQPRRRAHALTGRGVPRPRRAVLRSRHAGGVPERPRPPPRAISGGRAVGE